ncbi:glutamate ligase domain-containing protein [Paracandidimonas soli]|uniref:Mur ligase-like protein n=1 Tax=Paracandidimonas soli TaxID=1917182 RepID=A0A4R3UT82_9BURK|nr:cyanophycin synthetase [Paracandidimonas soli]TCU93873.1 Mur ligase-like protein [Paracandidimonas soli]
MPNLEAFAPIKGRGQVLSLRLGDRHISVIDQAYNANPLSMTAALAALEQSDTLPAHRVVVLGDMLELGENAADYHVALKDPVLQTCPDRLLLCGELMHDLWRTLEPEMARAGIKGKWFASAAELKAELDAWLQDGDTVLIKSSNSIGFEKIIAGWMEEHVHTGKHMC